MIFTVLVVFRFHLKRLVSHCMTLSEEMIRYLFEVIADLASFGQCNKRKWGVGDTLIMLDYDYFDSTLYQMFST